MSGKEYRGINVFLLGCTGYTSPYFLTFNQANRVGAHVLKGERGYPVICWKFGEREIQDAGEFIQQRPVLCRYYTVFFSGMGKKVMLKDRLFK